MRYEVCEASPTFYRVKGLPKKVSDFVMFSVKPKLRYYDEGAWHVHSSQLLIVTQLGYSTCGYVNYSALPYAIQLQIATEKTTWHKGNKTTVPTKTVSKDSAYLALHLQPGAPEYVVNAVWKALARKHHPDVGGDEEVFKTYQAAYEVLKSAKEHSRGN